MRNEQNKTLESLVALLNHNLGRPASHLFVTEDGSTQYNLGHIFLDYDSNYGGYALREAENQQGGESMYWPRWQRVNAVTMEAFLEGQLLAISMVLKMVTEKFCPNESEEV